MERCSKEKWEEQEDKIVEQMSKYPISGSSFIWISSTCHDCGRVNWIDMMVEVEACKCFNCQKTFWISEKIYEDHKTNLVMANVFNSVDIREEEWVYNGKEKPDN